ncbi:hypothetical protein Q5Y75_01075 [Ruegeria sp. 2205SS24-7]|uniref:hypothetical protein n=1 Tax=Ruegeria discodermiae TaxID=3064389 RepID=UPI0027417232|nr:hypothetical protein [Ruegeria sp. 2205SS24-7]MDP5215799.1 hypothetical protein [Ruegeria sp. 2205SS24-7]
MKPAFALSLSFEGISLLHRAAGGWRVVGEVALDVPDLGGQLAELREKALRLEPEVQCKLILPDDQIKYLSVETHGFEGEALLHIIEGAVDSATPYDIDELVYDIAPEGEITHVAAVAQETLGEAESFAAEHGFVPVSFVASPGAGDFPGEPFFGLSQTAQHWTGSEAVEPDASVVVDIGPETLPEPQPVPDEADAPPPREIPAPDSPAPPPEEPEPELEVEPVAPEPADPSAMEEADPAPTDMREPETEPDIAPQKPRRMGLVLTLILLVALFLVGLWASVFLDTPVSRLFRSAPDPVVVTDAEPVEPESPSETEEAIADLIDALPAPDNAPVLSDTDAAVLDALTDENQPPANDPAAPNEAEEAIADLIDTLPAPVEIPDQTDVETAPDVLTDDPLLDSEPLPEPELLDPETLYAETGLWSVSPGELDLPAAVTLDDLYVASIDRTDLSQDPVALPPAAQIDTDLRVVVQTAPAIADAGFDLDDRGLVVPTPEGARSPDGILVYLGKPPRLPPETPLRFENEPEVDETREVLAQKRPRPRPENLQELNERARLGGRSLAELSGIRPKERPAAPQIQEQVEEIVATVALVDPIPRPRPRPQALAARAQQSGNLGSLANLDQQTQIRTVAPKVVKPSRPSPNSVARQATVKNAISLRKVSLIGVFGTPSNRRALVRMPNGRYKKVKVGDRIDGGRVVAIGDSELRYQKSGRNQTLKMPKG